jgi:ligand-binding sensor domain-containing protein
MCILAALAYGRVGEWKSYTDMRQVRAIVASGNDVWAATGGGVFHYSVRDSSFQKLTNCDGLSSNDVTAIAVNNGGDVWIGHSSGTIDVYAPATGTWRRVTDISSSPKTSKTIRSFFFAGDSLYIASDLGVSLFSLSKFEFRETYENLGALSQSLVTSSTFLGGQVFVSTTTGVAVSKPNATNLASPDSWLTFNSFSVPGTVAAFQGAVYLASAGGVFKYSGGGWVPVSGLAVAASGVVAADSILYVLQSRTLLAMTPAGIVSVVGDTLRDNITGAAATRSLGPVVSLAGNGIAVLKGTPAQWETTLPNGPASNQFSSMVVDDDGVLWCASSRTDGAGFYAYDGKTWRNYSTTTDPVLGTDAYFRVTLGPNNSKWFSSYGSGIAVVDSRRNVARMFNYAYPGFLGVRLGSDPDNFGFVVPGGVARDGNDNMWVALWHSMGPNGLWKMTPDSTWVPIRTALADNTAELVDVIIDNNNTKWIANSFLGTPVSSSLHYYNAERNLGQASDGWGIMGTSEGITNSVIPAIAVDHDGDVWVGTGSGISIIANPTNPTQGIRRVYVGAVVQESINVIAVDPLNNKWVATKQGVFVLSPDGTSLLSQYSVESTGGKLVDDNILAIQFDGNRGVVYFGSESGLSSLEIPATLPVEKFDGLHIAPNPFIIPDHPTVIINGLVEDSMIKIMTLQGTVIKAFPAQGGGRAFWDGTDEAGHMVGSGVYIVVAHSASGDGVATAKIAVLRR